MRERRTKKGKNDKKSAFLPRLSTLHPFVVLGLDLHSFLLHLHFVVLLRPPPALAGSILPSSSWLCLSVSLSFYVLAQFLSLLFSSWT